MRAPAFADVVGHARARATLEAMWREGRVPQALLLCGPRGSGRCTLAQRFAALLLGGDREGCVETGTAAAERIRHGLHPDVLLIEREEGRRQLSMDAVRALREEFALKPQEASRRVAILADADRLSAETGNALLKLLEEPPPTSHLILTVHSEAALMPTLLSRCVRLHLEPLPREELELFLNARGFSGRDAALAAAAAEGAPGRALALAEAGFSTVLMPAAVALLRSGNEPLATAAELFKVLDSEREKKNLESTRERMRGLLEALQFLCGVAERGSVGLGLQGFSEEELSALPLDDLNAGRRELVLAAHARLDANVAPLLVLEELNFELRELVGAVPGS